MTFFGSKSILLGGTEEGEGNDRRERVMCSMLKKKNGLLQSPGIVQHERPASQEERCGPFVLRYQVLR